MLKLHLLGRFEVVRADAPIPAHAWRRRRPADLLKLVALAPGRTLGRDAAIEALWPDKDPASGAKQPAPRALRSPSDPRRPLGGHRSRAAHAATRRVDRHRRVRGGERGRPGALGAGGRPLPRRPLPGGSRFSPGSRAAARSSGAASSTSRCRWRGPRRSAATPPSRSAPPPRARRRSRQRGDPPAAHDPPRGVRPARGGAPPVRRLRERAPGRRARRRLRRHARALERDPAWRGRTARGAARARGARRVARRLLGKAEPPPVRGRGPALLLLESLLEQGAGSLVFLGERGVGKTRLAVEGARLAQARGAAVLCGVATGGGAPAASSSTRSPTRRARARPSRAPSPAPRRARASPARTCGCVSSTRWSRPCALPRTDARSSCSSTTSTRPTSPR